MFAAQLGNHDQHRVASRFSPELVDGLNFLAHLLPGVGVTYNGEEIGMENTLITWEQCRDPQGLNAGPDHYLERTRDLERTPFQWDNSNNAGSQFYRCFFNLFIAMFNL
jgi:alpha-glucosidase